MVRTIPSRRGRATRLLVAVLPVLGVAVGACRLPAVEPPSIALGDSAVAKQLQQWWAEGTAAGNLGDFYDNRDRLHSNLQVKQLFPQLSRVEYSTNDVKAGRDYGPAVVVHAGVTVGNSSTARAATEGGGNARTLYARADGLSLLYAQYRANNLYVYPEHQDHDSGWNGRDGYGDLIPANTPYLLVSQGSSTSDLPFVRAAVYTLAAFRPETKKRLAEAGLLMPTLQMLFRWCATNVLSEADYLSGKAHPTAFDPSVVNTVRMCRMAHEIQADALPPLAQIEVVREDRSRGGVHSFDSAASEIIGDSPCAVARLWRSSTGHRRLAVSAKSSLDPQGRALRFHWAVLRGDTNSVEIRPLNEAGSVVEIRAAWPRHRPVTDGSALESSRIDIGVFVHNGVWWSPPAFVTWFGSVRESRTLDEFGRVLDIGYFAGAPFLDLLEAATLSGWLGAEPPAASATALARLLGSEETARLRQDAAAPDARVRVPGRLREWLETPDWAARNAATLDSLLTAASAASSQKVVAARARLMSYGLDAGANEWAFRGILGEGLWTEFERQLLAEFNVTWFDVLLAVPGLEVVYEANFADSNLFAPKLWRDLHHYDSRGTWLGWRRYFGTATPLEFTADGLLVTSRDTADRPLEAVDVVYQRTPQPGLQGADVPVSWKRGSRAYAYLYDGPGDVRGRPLESR